VVKYQPYKSCQCYVCQSVKRGFFADRARPRRIRTDAGWAYDPGPNQVERQHPWRLADTRAANRYVKRLAHRAFRRLSKDAIRRELGGDDAVSHAFYVSGEYWA
jgi:hypothetical protein